MLDQMDETQSPRFCISVREEIARLDPDNSDNLGELKMLRDYIDPKLPMAGILQTLQPASEVRPGGAHGRV